MLEEKSLYDELQQMLKEDFSVPEEVKDDEEGYSELDYLKHRISKFIQANYKMLLIGICYGLSLAYLIYQVICLLLTCYYVDPGYIYKHPVIFLIWFVVPFVIWVLSTLYDYWNYHNRKMAGITFAIINVGIIMAQFLYMLYCSILLPIFREFPTSPDISLSMVYNLTRFVFVVLTALPVGFFLNGIMSNLYSTISKRAIFKFKLGKHIDRRKNVEFSYDMQIVNDLETGQSYTIKEKDRSLHSVANGTTGTGKTSSLFTVAIAHDMDKIVHNLKYQKKKVETLLKKGLIRMIKTFTDQEFSLDNFEVVKGDKDVLDNLKIEAPLAGITAMAPNASFSDEIYNLAQQKGLKVNRLDPTLKNGKLKEGFIGFNPLYINPDLTRLDWMMEVSRKAVLFADVTQAVYDANGQSDVYFASLNKNITTTVTMLVILTYPHLNNGKQPTPEAVQEILNDFRKAKIYRDTLIRLYGKKNDFNKPIMDAGKADVGPFQSVLDIIDNEILGAGAEKIFDQCRGLRVIINSFMTNPLIKNALCAEETIDLDKALANGEITLVNYALELGSDSVAFGLFFLLSFISAVFRRPGSESTRIPNFFYIDELPVLLHPRIESCFSLFRQYRVPMFVAIQGLSQMEKQPSTKFLKNVLLGNCAHHFVFGRVAPEEMKLYQELAGTEFYVTEMKGYSESSITTENPSINFNTRETIQRDNVVYGGDVRNQDFQEVFVITVDNGSPVPAFHGKVSFLPAYERVKIKKFQINWNKYYKEPKTVLSSDNINDTEMEKTEDVMAVPEDVVLDETIKEISTVNLRDFAKTQSIDRFSEGDKQSFVFSAGKPEDNTSVAEEEIKDDPPNNVDDELLESLDKIIQINEETQSSKNVLSSNDIDINDYGEITMSIDDI